MTGPDEKPEPRPLAERLTLKVWENGLGYWCHAVYSGDGEEPGSLKAASGGHASLEAATEKGLADVQRRVVIRACDHEWRPWEHSRSTDYCPKCGIVKGVSLGSP